MGAAAETWPSRPIRMIVPIAPGGPTDTVARLLGVHLGEILGQQIVVDNRAGASGMIGMQLAKQAAPDGYTLVMGNAGAIGVSLALFKDAQYTADDFQTISMVMTVPLILVVRSELPVRSVRELVAYMKANPNKLAIASSGYGQTPYIATELFRQQAGVEAVVVPFKGAAPAAADLVAGNTQLMFDSTPTLPYIKDGTLRALAICNAQRSALMPDVPTMAEAGKGLGLDGFDVTSWYVVLAPTGTPQAIVARLHDAIATVMARADVKEKLASMNSEAVSSTPEAADTYVRAQIAHYRDVIQRTGIKPE
ncbi:MAG: tripartite tricarboxylate transporter substrate binding protein [Alphaproteobacteria bacterium]|nr:tripartite tricarboxylate transporter substrate binding protein [Alphaproteobacteria bacterium]